MTNKTIRLLERAARVRHALDKRSNTAGVSAIEQLRAKRLLLIIRQKLEACLATAMPIPLEPVPVFVRVGHPVSARRK